MTLRAPNFLLPGPSNNGSSNNTAAAAAANNSGNNRLLSLSSYTSKCQQQLLLAVSKSIDDGSDNDEKTTSDDNVINTNSNGKGKGNNNTSSREGNNEPSVEQCILLLESHLSGFQKSCRQKEDKHSTDVDGKKKKRKKAHHATKQHEVAISVNDSDNGDGGDVNEDDDDEVPPQLLRLARFFHYRWVPIKRALLRPVEHSTDGDKNPAANNEQQSTSPVEIGLKYRLRLAKACWKHGLVAAAEYEMLIASLTKVLEPSCSSVNDDINGGMKCKAQSDGGGDEVNLMERMRLALLRLPTDATITSSISTSSSSQATATAAWRHVKEMMLECCRYWEKNGVTISMVLPSATSVEGEDAALLTKLGISKVVDWALTSWTALLLSQGVDCFTATSSSTLTISNSNDPISKIEKEFAIMLSNRSHSIGKNNDPNPLLLFAMAVSNRINEILSHDHLKQMSGIHILSMARLLAKFQSRDNAEEHIMTSIITCSLVKGGGMDCLDPLSRLLAIYCCNISIVDGDAAPEDSLVGKIANRTTCADLEGRLCSKLNDEEFVERVVSSFHKEEGQQSPQRETGVSRAKSFMDVIFSMTAHFIKCGRN
mmetsp:Transcript_13349/g.22781  ORF Transcript_13349/g.22781 Transcript_13349/m.22781 type:complete len:597 (+) Transcript_13349:184-1974(+)